MTISQMRQVSPVEASPRPEQQPPTPEREVSRSPEAAPAEIAPESRAREPRPPATPLAPTNVMAPTKPDRLSQIESILEADLEDIYFNLDETARQEFKTKGEVTAAKIDQLLAKPRVKIKKIIALIKDWLSIIPGVNKFFLEQTAKIKADKIVDSYKL